MRNLALTLLMGLLFANMSLFSQDCTFYFPTKKGTSIEMKSYDAKNKQTTTSKSVITDVTGNSVKFNSEVWDSKGKSISKGDLEVKCEGGEYIVDMKSYLQNIDVSKYKGMEMKIESKNISIPSKLQVGQKLNDGEVDLKFQFMTISVKVLNRTVVGFEDITTPAGTFKCAKITSDVESKIVFNSKTKSTEWIAEKVGVVRSESHDQKDKLLGYTELTAFNQ